MLTHCTSPRWQLQLRHEAESGTVSPSAYTTPETVQLFFGGGFGSGSGGTGSGTGSGATVGSGVGSGSGFERGVGSG
jgi:hypothetical protein